MLKKPFLLCSPFYPADGGVADKDCYLFFLCLFRLFLFSPLPPPLSLETPLSEEGEESAVAGEMLYKKKKLRLLTARERLRWRLKRK